MTSPPPRDDVVHTDHWRISHAFNSTLPGWLVLMPTRHVLAFADLSEVEAGEMGDLVRRMSTALVQVTGCAKTYLMQFSEAEGHAHLHLHLVPRLPEQPDYARGPGVFALLADEEGHWLAAGERDTIALALREAFARA